MIVKNNFQRFSNLKYVEANLISYEHNGVNALKSEIKRSIK